ncbi:hypothetical protein K3740_08750 [Ruegeria conchae]|uniref:hypothetical protein n=1 Tax=Ruegeria conchae TaxID=981384 RepID=UPI0021A9238F|nr:hypothetical protein [Ruegeria conchae]UWR04749.1 hypothetical protein K3740_08750 [Ruegeria conchae]
MPFDMTNSRKPKKPKIDRDAAALAVQRELGRPLSWSEYAAIWNTLTEAAGRKDFLQ